MNWDKLNLWFRTAVLAACGLLLAGCGIDEEGLAGVWEGRSSDTAYVFDLQPDGTGRVKIVTAQRTADYICGWSVSGDRLKLTHERGRTTSFKIMDQSDSELALRMASGPSGVCQLRRTGLR